MKTLWISQPEAINGATDMSYLLSAYARNFQWLRFLPETGANTSFRLYRKKRRSSPPPFCRSGA